VPPFASFAFNDGAGTLGLPVTEAKCVTAFGDGLFTTFDLTRIHEFPGVPTLATTLSKSVIRNKRLPTITSSRAAIRAGALANMVNAWIEGDVCDRRGVVD